MTDSAARFLGHFDLDVTLRDAALDEQNRPTRRMIANAAIGMHVEDAFYSVRELREAVMPGVRFRRARPGLAGDQRSHDSRSPRRHRAGSSQFPARAPACRRCASLKAAA